MTLLAELDESMPTKIKLEGPLKYSELIKTIPGTKWSMPADPANPRQKLPQAWRVTLSWQACLALRATFRENLQIGPNLNEWARRHRQMIIEPALALRTATEAPGYEGLFPYQRAGVQFMATTKRALLTDGMGAGKTRQAFSTMRLLYETGTPVFPVLVVAPNSTLLSWEREIQQVWPGLKVNIIKGPMGKRRKLLEEKAHVYIINWEGVRSHSRLQGYGPIALKKCHEHGGVDPKVTATQCQVHPKELNAIEFGAVIGDEIHRIKDPSSQTTRAFKAATGEAEVRIALSGTPIASDPSDLWSPLNWMLPDAYPSRTKFIERFMDQSFNAWGGETIIGVKPHMEQEFYAGIDPHLRHMPKELVLSFLPPIVYERRDVEMAAKQKKAYEQMRDKMIAELENDVLVVTSALTKTTRMVQLASSFGELETRIVREKVTDDEGNILYDEAGNPRVKDVEKDFLVLTDPSCKIDAFMDDLPDFGDESVVVFAVSRQLIELLSKKLDKKNIPHGLITGAQTTDERQKHMDDFQAGKTKLILVTTGAGGTGITLTAASIAVFLQRPWSMIESAQAEARVHRIGSEIHEVIRIIDYITDDSIEETIAMTIEQKGEQLEKILRSKDLLIKMLKENIINPDEESA